MLWKEIYIRFLAYISIICISAQTIFNLIIIQNKVGLDYFLHISVEICYWYMSVSFCLVIRTWKLPRIEQKLKENKIKKEQYPTIDILVPCYNEDESLIKKTLVKAQKINYNSELFQIYLLDDSKRISLKIFCDENGINYVTRLSNKFQKPGNVNNLLRSQEITLGDLSLFEISPQFYRKNPSQNNRLFRKRSSGACEVAILETDINILDDDELSKSQRKLSLSGSSDKTPNFENDVNRLNILPHKSSISDMATSHTPVPALVMVDLEDTIEKDDENKNSKISSDNPLSVSYHMKVLSDTEQLPSEPVHPADDPDKLPSESSHLAPDLANSRRTSLDDSQKTSSSNSSSTKNSDFICILDCDMEPEPDIFQTLVPYLFKKKDENNESDEYILDEQLAFVQPRQYFYNCPYHKDYYDMDNCVYVKITMPSMNEIGNAPYIGTNALISRKALKDVDYFLEGHATEDTITSMIMCSTLSPDGTPYQSKYVYPQLVASGFAPETLAEAFDQRLRWVKGSIQLIMNKNPICTPNLTKQQKLVWFTTNAYWIFGIIFFGQFFSHIYILIVLAFYDVRTNLDDMMVYQFSFVTQLVSFMLLPELTILEKVRSLQMFVCYIPVYVYSFLSHLCGCISISKVSNKGEQRTFHVLFIFHIIVLVSIYSLCLYCLIALKLNGWEYAKLGGLIIAYTAFFFPVIRTLICYCCPQFSRLSADDQESSQRLTDDDIVNIELTEVVVGN